MTRYRLPILGEVQLHADDPESRSSGAIEVLTNAGNYKLIQDLADFPDAVNGVITLEDNKTYMVVSTVDLLGARIVAGVNTAILGGSSENSRLKSTGLGGTALITSNYSLPMRGITIEANVAVNLDGDGSTTALDWFGVNFTDCATVGTIRDYTNVIWTDCAMLNSANLTFDGIIGTAGFSQCLFDGRTGQSTIILPSTLNITRRFRIIYSAFVTLSGETSLNVSTSATIPVDGYILDTVNFAGGGTYTAGVPFDDNKALFLNCRGISNSAAIAHLTMAANATATVVGGAGIPVKVAGTTVLRDITQKFTMPANNRLTYGGATLRDFRASVVATFTSGANDKIGIYVAKNGTVLAESEIYATANASGRAENIMCQTIAQMAQNDYFEIFVENDAATNNITVSDMNVIIESVN